LARLDWFIISPSSRIAGLCHSIQRGEPFTTCQLGCAYCYARWYRGPHGEPEPVRGLGRLVWSLAEAQESLGAALPLRVATLSDPFQPAEEIYGRTLRLLRLAQRHGVPVILNTRLPPPSREHEEALKDLAATGLLLVQVTITGLDDVWGILRRVEPGSPPPGERFRVVEWASGIGAPVMVRLQPVIPGVGDRSPRRFMEAAREAGARGVIIEYIRVERELAEALERLLAMRPAWEPYAAEEAGLLHPPLDYRLESALSLWRAASSEGLIFQTCKEGFFHLHGPPGMDCCGYQLLGVKTARRPHLYDVYMAVLRGGVPAERAVDEACRRGGEELLCGDRIEVLPSWIRRAYRLHERRLRRILLKRPELVSKMAPALRVVDGVVEAALLPP